MTVEFPESADLVPQNSRQLEQLFYDHFSPLLHEEKIDESSEYGDEVLRLRNEMEDTMDRLRLAYTIPSPDDPPEMREEIDRMTNEQIFTALDRMQELYEQYIELRPQYREDRMHNVADVPEGADTYGTMMDRIDTQFSLDGEEQTRDKLTAIVEAMEDPESYLYKNGEPNSKAIKKEAAYIETIKRGLQTPEKIAVLNQLQEVLTAFGETDPTLSSEMKEVLASVGKEQSAGMKALRLLGIVTGSVFGVMSLLKKDPINSAVWLGVLAASWPGMLERNDVKVSRALGYLKLPEYQSTFTRLQKANRLEPALKELYIAMEGEDTMPDSDQTTLSFLREIKKQEYITDQQVAMLHDYPDLQAMLQDLHPEKRRDILALFLGYSDESEQEQVIVALRGRKSMLKLDSDPTRMPS